LLLVATKGWKKYVIFKPVYLFFLYKFKKLRSEKFVKKENYLLYWHDINQLNYHIIIESESYSEIFKRKYMA